MLTSRERILGKLRAAGARAPTLDTASMDHRIDLHYATWRPLAEATHEQRIDAFERALIAAHAEVWRASAATWVAEMARRIADAGVSRLLLDTQRAEGAALAAALPDTVEPLPFAQPIETWKRELFDTVEAGFTVARSGIAATGTLVIEPDRGSPRTMSLAPPLHIALVHADTLHRDLHEAARAERWREGMPTNLALVSGPSKTSDIQQTLAYGAHGPRRLWVVIVTDEGKTSTATPTEQRR
ncbi:LUD domain-containing protein [Trinickia sp. NRRL B-1857]|uniref:LutC/YkgG family protein n=1 Tax=Trinickia sp. NRRL B-1857 TaxID=3162879 RepID=UPI003D2688F1